MVDSVKQKVLCFIITLLLFLNTNTTYAKYQHTDNYIILTSPSLVSVAQLFANYRSLEFNVSIITTKDIGSSNAEAIRSYLAEHFNSGYLLIIGSEKTIPRPLMFPSDTEHNVSTSIPCQTETDLYYALLNEDIDKDKDGYPGELYGDRIQIKPNLIVGRIPFDEPLLVQEVYENTVNFEKNPSSKAVLAASFISFPGEEYNGARILNGDGAREMELIKKFLPLNSITLYERDGSYPSVYDCTLPLNKSNFLDSIKGAAFVDWDAHGSSSAAYGESWLDKNGNGIPDDGFTFKEFMNKTDDFKASGIFFSGSCLNENGDDNLGKSILRKGAAVFIGSTEISFTPSYFAHQDDGGSSSINYYFTRELTEGNSVGRSLYDSFEYFFNTLLYKDIEDPVAGSLMNIYDLNIYGDPATMLNAKNYNSTSSSTSIKPLQGIDTNVLISNQTATLSCSTDQSTSFFIILPKGFSINGVSVKNAIIDRGFNIIRTNDFSGTLEVNSTLRGAVVGDIIVKNDFAQSIISINASGYDVFDFNFDGADNSDDYRILLSSFGKTYMQEGFNELCDINSDHRIDGRDLFAYLFGK